MVESRGRAVTEKPGSDIWSDVRISSGEGARVGVVIAPTPHAPERLVVALDVAQARAFALYLDQHIGQAEAHNERAAGAPPYAAALNAPGDARPALLAERDATSRARDAALAQARETIAELKRDHAAALAVATRALPPEFDAVSFDSWTDKVDVVLYQTRPGYDGETRVRVPLETAESLRRSLSHCIERAAHVRSSAGRAANEDIRVARFAAAAAGGDASTMTGRRLRLRAERTAMQLEVEKLQERIANADAVLADREADPADVVPPLE